MTRALIGLIILGALTGSATAQDATTLAEREFVLAQQAEDKSLWDEALKHYVASYEAVPHPFTAYNIGKNYERLGSAREAAAYYRRYLTGSKSAPDRAEIEAHVDGLRKRPGLLEVVCAGKVTLDGKPWQRGQKIYGPHVVACELANDVQTRQITIEYGERLRAQFVAAGGGGAFDLVVSSPGKPSRVMPLLVGGVGLASIAAGGVLLAIHRPETASTPTYRNSAPAGYAFLGVGGALTAVAVYMWFAAPPGPVVAPAPNGAVVGWHGRF